jgi:RNA polymerase sigma-70 factor (ECF subfamily)
MAREQRINGLQTVSVEAARVPATRTQLIEQLADCSGTLFCRALSLTHDRMAAADLLQDTVVRGLDRLDRFRPGTNMRAWLTRVMFNIYIDGCRRQQNHRIFVQIPDDVQLQDPEVESSNADRMPSVPDIERAIIGLDPIHRRAFELRVTWKLSYQDIARQLGIPVRTVATRIHRARRHLRAELFASASPPEFAQIGSG